MWLADDKSSHQKESVVDGKQHNPSSPPLEGGESLCDFYLEGSDEDQKLKRLHGHSEHVENKHVDNLRQRFEEEAFYLHSDHLSNSNPFLSSLLSKELVPSNTFTHSFLQSILSSVDSRDPVVANAWMETLLDVIDLLPKDIIKRDILTLAINKGQISQPVSSRLLCCKMLGKICTKFDPYIIRKEILPVVQSLCQDVDHEVRGCMCRQLDVVARGIGLEATKSAILPELVELANDEESYVRLTGIETVVQMLPMLDDETCIQAIIPLVKKFCENSIRSEDATLPVIARHLGRLCHGLAVNLTPDQQQWFLTYYRELAKLGLPHHRKSFDGDFISLPPMPDIVPKMDNQDKFAECRHACAYNFPAMVLFAEPVNFSEELYNTFSDLCLDPHYDVRKTIACGFHEVTKLLESTSSNILKELVLLLQDDCLEVLRGLIPHLPESLAAVTRHLGDNNETKEEIGELLHALVICENATSMTSNWRLHADVLTQLSCLPHCLPSEQIYSTFVPLLFNKIHTARPIPCRVAAAYSLLVYLRNTPQFEQRNDIINRLIEELCQGRSCHSRMLFIRVCELVMELFSKSFFKQYFFRPLLKLSEDPVPNVRLRLCSVLPQLKAQIKLPTDGSLLQELEACVRVLMTDERDRDVAAAVRNVIEELDKIEVSMEPSSTRTSCAESEIDLEDIQKEEEERQLLEREFQKKQPSEGKLKKSQSTRSLPRHAKIPVRKSGTFPKQYSNKYSQKNVLKSPISSPTNSYTSNKGTSVQSRNNQQQKKSKLQISKGESQKTDEKKGLTKTKENNLSIAENPTYTQNNMKLSNIPIARKSPGSSPKGFSQTNQINPEKYPSSLPISNDYNYFLTPNVYHSNICERAPSPHPAFSEQLLGVDLEVFSSLTLSYNKKQSPGISTKCSENLSPESSNRSIQSANSNNSSSQGSRIPTPTAKRRSFIAIS